MKRKTIAVMKIRHAFFDLISAGIKQYEIRDVPLDGIDIISYRDAKSGAYLGSYCTSEVLKYTRDQDETVRKLSSIDANAFYQLFPAPEQGGPDALWAIKLSNPVSLKDLFGFLPCVGEY